MNAELIARLNAAADSSDWDVRKYWKELQESGLDGMSHEDGWTLMATTSAEALRANQIPPADREK